ncbi:glycoside hydrolase family 3 protein [Neobacillus sp. SM06]|uniref:glycoside hydrolase family 3 protein n=1 Tax=Neobacillus sp. SM06 TaxID=3422492 RepID=UPI003D2AB9D8
MKSLLKTNTRRKNYSWKRFIIFVLVSAILSQETSIQASVEQSTAAALSGPVTSNFVHKILLTMTDKEKIGQLVMPSVRDGQASDQHIQHLIKTYGSGSVIYYGKANAEKIAKFTNQLQKWASETRLQIPLFISGDLEYGPYQHVTDGTDFPRQMAIGATRDRKTAEQIAKITAIELKAMGFNWNYSPLTDVNTNPANPVIGVRSFGEKTDLVSQMAVAQIKGYQENGVVATAKHFPGHGDTNADSHLHLAAVNYDRKTLEEIHLPPFKEAIAAGVDAIMTAHVIIDSIDAELPATLSKKVVTGLLRNQMRFNGIIVTDSMSMDAIDHHWGTGQAAVMAINAGADIVMATGSYKHQLETYHALYHAFKSGELTEKRVNDSVKRILSAKVKYDLFNHRYVDPVHAKKVVNNPEHKKIAAKAAKKSITVLKNENVLPFKANDKHATIFVVGPEIFESRKQMEAIIQSVRHKTFGKVTHTITSADPTAAEIQNATNLANQADRLIVATYSASTLSQGQIRLVKALESSGKPLVVLSLGLPYDIKHFPAIGAYIASYAIDRWGSPVPSSWNAAVDVLFGSKPEGKLPVSIKGLYQFGDGLAF